MLIIHLARKPLSESSVAANVMKHGTGAVNVDAARITGIVPEVTGQGFRSGECGGQIGQDEPTPSGVSPSPHLAGRWPANLILQHLQGCRLVGTKSVRPANGSGVTGPGAHGFHTAYVGGTQKGRGFTWTYVGEDGTETVADWRCATGCPVEELDRLSLAGGMHGAGHARNKVVDKASYAASAFEIAGPTDMRRMGDSGGASRFFKQVGLERES